MQQPAADELPREAEWLIGPTVTMRTNILGCKITLTADNNNDSLLLGEAILAFVESFLATTINPLVPLSSLCTIPGRSGAPGALSSPYR